MNIAKIHKEIYGKLPNIVSSAPGRVNIIGEHTDYNGGYALPIAIDRYIRVALSERKDPLVRVYSGNFKQEGEFTTRELELLQDDPLWLKYVKGVFWVLEDIGIPLYGSDISIVGNIPIGSGLSSSAALTVALVLLLIRHADVTYEEENIPYLAQRVETDYIGVNCGLMDQMISFFGRKDKALFIDFKNMHFSHIPFDLKDNTLFVFDTKAKRALLSSFYNKRRKECEEGLALLNNCLKKNYPYLGNIQEEEYKLCKKVLPEPINKRVEHVIYENERVKEATKLLQNGDIEGLGKLLYKTHESLSTLYEVSSFELDTAVEIAKEFGAQGARMTGAGFGGCTINIIKKGQEEEFSRYIKEEYKKKTGITPEVYKVEVVDGAKIL